MKKLSISVVFINNSVLINEKIMKQLLCIVKEGKLTKNKYLFFFD
jgi:hypothetical protein